MENKNKTAIHSTYEMHKRVSFEAAEKIMSYADSYSRLSKLLNLAHVMDEGDWLKILGENWSTCDNIGFHYSNGDFENVTHLWKDGPILEMMTEDEQKAFSELPDEVIVYRGCTEINKWGLSWSLDRVIAETFPFLNRYHHGGNRPLLVKARIKKTQITALKLDRNEAEVLCLGVMPKHISTSTARDVRVKGGEKVEG